MYDKKEDTIERSSLPPSRKEAKAKCNHIDRMQHGSNPNNMEKK